MNLILLEPGEVVDAARVVLRDHRALHIRTVLHAKPGDSLRVGVLDGPLGVAEAIRVDGDQVEIQCCLGGEAPPRPRIDLLLALPRPKVMKRLWAQLAALGVGRIILTNAWKVERNYFDTHVLNPDFFRPLLVEGLQQAQDTRLPEVSVHKQFKVLVEDDLDRLAPDALRLAADARGDVSMLDAVSGRERRVLLAVGPEGGWTEYETNLLKAHGFTRVSMGRRTLRADTACVALLALAHERLRDCV
ncbi:MAG: 16S ribosomal RNA methyltransferase RsmE [Verrucomicrobia bacterium ADurb.Bin345]|nr:MAG: 16S ribosomal RNA methyltransferase RsmE [Verrucomicrobia bacterium ADurb.Bin345]